MLGDGLLCLCCRAAGPRLRVRGPSGLLGHLRVSSRRGRPARVAEGREVPVQQKTPRAVRHARGSAPVLWSGRWWSPRSADAPSKYENSGAHGFDLPLVTGRVSSEWDTRLIMWSRGVRPPPFASGPRPDGTGARARFAPPYGVTAGVVCPARRAPR
ncbi:hypothetical protein SCATT_43250 [Streptantibioticus cattleyicolor NRRL 8057 = DSM 46488]|uniref:Uncharacterized protein n=1 Tax=Streptantibioticus cattleyicolor (strain ATCC 35852 / DSM 46488 / JCM 4925 / NBRC 14057 / NRRL 8057) TaxID=1003195 RepID=G8WSY8_STREN|nr:hypothetical protein SCATT_43250 [Streptantibioticus cattleyicolor NRRL 8057 = DSM 46488]